jgi:hypothetical protein
LQRWRQLLSGGGSSSGTSTNGIFSLIVVAGDLLFLAFAVFSLFKFFFLFFKDDNRLINLLFPVHVIFLFVVAVFDFDVRNKEILKRVGPEKVDDVCMVCCT